MRRTDFDAMARAGALVLLLFAGGCAGTYTTTATVGDPYGPDLVYAAPGVQVIADYNEPIFYSDGFYWRYYGNSWYRSSYYSGGWVYAAPPVAVLRINRPYAYVHYRPQGWRPRAYAPAPAGRPVPVQRGWAGHPAAQPPAQSGWRGHPVAQPAPSGGGWRPPASAPAAAPHAAPSGGGWRGRAAPPPRH